MELVGFLKFPLNDFYELEPYECVEIMEKARTRFKYEHELMYVAIMNALGKSNSKTYKYYDVFKNNDKKTTVTDEERAEMIAYLQEW